MVQRFRKASSERDLSTYLHWGSTTHPRRFGGGRGSWIVLLAIPGDFPLRFVGFTCLNAAVKSMENAMKKNRSACFLFLPRFYTSICATSGIVYLNENCWRDNHPGLKSGTTVFSRRDSLNERLLFTAWNVLVRSKIFTPRINRVCSRVFL